MSKWFTQLNNVFTQGTPGYQVTVHLLVTLVLVEAAGTLGHRAAVQVLLLTPGEQAPSEAGRLEGESPRQQHRVRHLWICQWQVSVSVMLVFRIFFFKTSLTILVENPFFMILFKLVTCVSLLLQSTLVHVWFSLTQSEWKLKYCLLINTFICKYSINKQANIQKEKIFSVEITLARISSSNSLKCMVIRPLNITD